MGDPDEVYDWTKYEEQVASLNREAEFRRQRAMALHPSRQPLPVAQQAEIYPFLGFYDENGDLVL